MCFQGSSPRQLDVQVHATGPVYPYNPESALALNRSVKPIVLLRAAGAMKGGGRISYDLLHPPPPRLECRSLAADIIYIHVTIADW